MYSIFKDLITLAILNKIILIAESPNKTSDFSHDPKRKYNYPLDNKIARRETPSFNAHDQTF